ncbi:MAG TPA: peptidylprolyl isomerase [Gammaproteobacteria bacterium]|nr:peptidylprolyl isomerase [Gammaproteobacteria bacterium]
MSRNRSGLLCGLLAIVLCAVSTALAAADDRPTPTRQQILDASRPDEWRSLDPAQTLYMRLAHDHLVVIELAPDWAPAHVANIKTLVREHYFDGTSVYRVQDNFVVQWGDPADDPKQAKSMGTAKTRLPPEYTRPMKGIGHFTLLPDGDVYAPQVGFVDGLPVGRDPKTGRAWLVQCYGMVGVSRDNDPMSGNGNTLYVPIGQAPRRLDHQLAVVGRVVQGMEWLSALPRGTGPLGIYTDPALRTPIVSVRLAADVPIKQRLHLQVLRTDSKSFARLLDATRNRHGAFYKEPPGHVGICDAPLPVREAPGK